MFYFYKSKNTMAAIIIWQGICILETSAIRSKHKVYERFLQNLFDIIDLANELPHNLPMFRNVRVPMGVFRSSSKSRGWMESTFEIPRWTGSDAAIANKTIWGRKLWSFIYIVCSLYTDQTKRNLLKFLDDFQYVLPCAECRVHYAKLIAEDDIKQKKLSISSRSGARKYVDVLKAEVSKRKENYHMPPPPKIRNYPSTQNKVRRSTRVVQGAYTKKRPCNCNKHAIG